MNKFGVMNPRDPNAYKCCFCCHVKVGTILYGLLCLMADIFCLGFVVLLTIHPDILLVSPDQTGVGPQFDGIYVNDLKDKMVTNKEGIHPRFTTITKENLCTVFAITVGSMLTAVALLYGVIRSRPTYMVPFFCVHVFLFCMSCLTLISYFTYSPRFDVKMWMKDTGLSDMPGMEHVTEIDADYLMFLVAILLILLLCVKAYLINMIWACYKYVQHLSVARTLTREYQVDPDTEMLMPPRYEDAIKMHQAGTQPPPPPPYTQ